MPISQLSESSQTSIIRFLTSDGTIAGPSNINANYSVVNQTFFTGPPIGEVWRVKLIFVSMIASNGFNSAGYAGSNTPLANGLLILLNSPSVGGIQVASNFTRNSGFQDIATDLEQVAYQAGAFGIKANLNYEQFGMPGIILNGNNGDTVSALARDNFTTQSIQVQRLGIYGGVI